MTVFLTKRSFRSTVFLLDDSQVVNEAFLEDVNGILNTGEVPSLFNSEEMAAISEAITKSVNKVITVLLCLILLSLLLSLLLLF